MSGLREVLAAHEVCLTSWVEVCGCTCGENRTSGPGPEGDDWAWFREHLADAVTAWMAERLSGAREYVALAIHEGEWHDEGECYDARGCSPGPMWAADGALGVVSRALGVEVDS